MKMSEQSVSTPEQTSTKLGQKIALAAGAVLLVAGCGVDTDSAPHHDARPTAAAPREVAPVPTHSVEAITGPERLDTSYARVTQNGDMFSVEIGIAQADSSAPAEGSGVVTIDGKAFQSVARAQVSSSQSMEIIGTTVRVGDEVLAPEEMDDVLHVTDTPMYSDADTQDTSYYQVTVNHPEQFRDQGDIYITLNGQKSSDHPAEMYGMVSSELQPLE